MSITIRFSILHGQFFTEFVIIESGIFVRLIFYDWSMENRFSDKDIISTDPIILDNHAD